MTNRCIVLVGFMGCGKTTVAQELARRLACSSIDLDTFITKTHGSSPAEIIQQDGEPAFRLLETRALEDLLKQPEVAIIALGGGAWTIPANRRLVENHNCLSIWLDAPFELCWQRIDQGDYQRPLAPDRETARRLYETRRADYQLAQIRINVGTEKGLAEILDEISRKSAPYSPVN